MRFRIVNRYFRVPQEPRHHAYLHTDNWDDWGKFATYFALSYVDDEGVLHKLGGVKIGQFGMMSGQRTPTMEDTFDEVDKSIFSLGQDNSYYEGLNSLGDRVKNEILIGLNDIAKDEELFERALNEEVTKISLLRFVTPSTVRGQFHRIINGGIPLSGYNFTYQVPKHKGSSAPTMILDFHVIPESHPPTNIHVLIGRNGVGKTYLIEKMIKSLIQGHASNKYGRFTFEDDQLFANVVSVTFSAFDESEPLPEQRDKSNGIQYSYVGLKRNKRGDNQNLEPKTPTILKAELIKSILACCKNEAKSQRWKRALEMLEADPIFKESNVASVAEGEEINEIELKEKVSELFNKLSSGHRIVLLTITRLVETVEERTLVLIDEPETHLHPPLLSAFTRALSDLLINRNGVAIVATHSPVILQEVPRSCVWKLRRAGAEAIAERLEIESFGENVGALTSEVFGLEVTDAGFHKLLIEAVQEENSYQEAVIRFSDQLGMEARAILRAMSVLKNSQQN